MLAKQCKFVCRYGHIFREGNEIEHDWFNQTVSILPTYDDIDNKAPEHDEDENIDYILQPENEDDWRISRFWKWRGIMMDPLFSKYC